MDASLLLGGAVDLCGWLCFGLSFFERWNVKNVKSLNYVCIYHIYAIYLKKIKQHGKNNKRRNA